MKGSWQNHVSSLSLALAALSVMGCSEDPESTPLTPVCSPDSQIEVDLGISAFEIVAACSRCSGIRNYGDFTATLNSKWLASVESFCIGTPQDYVVRVNRNGQPLLETTTSCTLTDICNQRGRATVVSPRFSLTQTGQYLIEVILDADDMIEEVDEANNRDTIRVNAILGDLTAETLLFSEPDTPFDYPSPSVPDTVTLGTEVRIVGVGYAIGYFVDYQVIMDRDGVEMSNQRYTNETSCVCGTISFPPTYGHVAWTAPVPGNYTFTLRLDPSQEMRESDRSNNVVSRTLTVLP